MEFNDFQFGFVSGIGTLLQLLHLFMILPLILTLKIRPSLCALEAEGAFDGIPHPILFKKAMNVLSDKSWK